MKKEEEFIYCKDCKYFPRWRLYGKRLATCKAHNKDRELALYSPGGILLTVFQAIVYSL